MPTKEKQIVQNGKIIPPDIVVFMDKVSEFMQRKPEEASLVLDVDLDFMLDLQDVIKEADITERLKDIAVTAVECISEMTDNDDMTFKEATENQIEIVNKLDNLKAAMTTLVMHRFAEEWGFDLPSDFRINGDGSCWSDAFPDED